MTDTDLALSAAAGIGRIGRAGGLFPGLPRGMAAALDECLGSGPIWFALGRDGGAAWIESGPSPQRLEASLQAGRTVGGADMPAPGIVQISLEDQTLDVHGAADLLLDVHGPRFPGLGVAEGLAAVRVEAGRARFRSRIGLPVWKMVERDESALRLRFFPERAKAAVFRAPTTCTPEESGTRLAMLAGALGGVHPCERLYAMLNLTGSRRWVAWASEIGALGIELEDFRARWLEMSRPAALAVWRASAALDTLETLFEWTVRLNHEFDGPTELDAALGDWSEADPGFRSSPAVEWIEAAAAESLDGPLTQSAFARLRAESRHLHAMLNDEPRLALLRRVHRWAAATAGAVPADAPEDLARRVWELVPEAAAEVWETRLAGLLQAADGGRPLADVTLCGAGVEATFRRIDAGDLDALTDVHQSGLLPGLGVLTHLTPRRLPVEVHLPFAGRCEPERRLEAIRGAAAGRVPGGQIALRLAGAGREAAERDRYQSILALAGSWRCGKTGVTAATYRISGGVEREIGDAASADCWNRLLESYGLSAHAEGTARNRAGRYALSLTLPGELAAAWTLAPPERDPDFFPLFKSVSAAVQSALRLWLPTLWFRDARRFAQTERALPLLFWAATEPFEAKNRASLTYDLFDHDAMERALRSGHRRLPALFSQVHASLEAAGQPRIARLYDPDERSEARTALRQRPRNFRSLLAVETFCVNQLIQLAAAGQHVRSLSFDHPIRALKLTGEFSERFATVVQQKLSRLFGDNEDFSPLAGIVLAEATAALTGRRDRLQAAVRIERDGETVVQVARPRAR